MRTTLCTIWLLTVPLAAHDFWIQPAQFKVSVPAVVPVHTLIGEHFRGERLIPNPALLETFELVSAAGRMPLTSGFQQDMAGVAAVRESGVAILAYRGKHSFINLRPDIFNKYLAEEGLDHVRAERKRQDAEQAMGRECFSRCAKSLVQAGADATVGFDRAVGHRLELIPRTNPFAGGSGDDMIVQLLFEGKPLAGVMVTALDHANPEAVQRMRSNRQGEVTFSRGEGVCLIKAVHMIPFTKSARADWESIWASLTFERHIDGDGVEPLSLD